MVITILYSSYTPHQAATAMSERLRRQLTEPVMVFVGAAGSEKSSKVYRVLGFRGLGFRV